MEKGSYSFSYPVLNSRHSCWSAGTVSSPAGWDVYFCIDTELEQGLGLQVFLVKSVLICV